MIRFFRIVILLALVGLLLWQTQQVKRSYDLYQLYMDDQYIESSEIIKVALPHATDEEFRIRLAADREEIRVRTNKPDSPRPPQRFISLDDTSKYKTLRISTMDTVFTVQYLTWDLHAIIEMKQYIFKGFMPVNLANLDSIYRRIIEINEIKVKQIYLEYLDLRANKVIDHYPEKKPPYSFDSDIYPLDILKHVGVKAYVQVETPDIWTFMKFRIITFSIVTILVIFGIFFLSRNLFQRTKKNTQSD